MKHPERELFLGLIKLLGGSAELYLLAARLMVELLNIAVERRREMGEVLDDMMALARIEQQTLPEVDVSALRRDLEELGQLRQKLKLDRLFSEETREQCGRYAVPQMALVLFQVWSRAEVFSEWLENAEPFRHRVFNLLHHRLSKDRKAD